MRLLFLTEVQSGGSLRSQRDLAYQLGKVGHEVFLLLPASSSARFRKWLYQQFLDLDARTVGHRLKAPVQWMMRRIGRKVSWSSDGGIRIAAALVVPNACPQVIDDVQPDAVVASSISRPSWRQVRSECRQSNVPSILYVREATSLDHTHFGDVPDLFMVNSRGLEEQLQKRGCDPVYVPSVVNVMDTKTETSRRVVLMINPIVERGVELVLDLAEQLPDIQFVLQESWLMSRKQIEFISTRTSHLSNVEFRRTQLPSGSLYRDSRVLLAPYADGDRPRVVLEAHANGIPVIGLDTVGLREAIGPGGIVLTESDRDGWKISIQRCFNDEDYYQSLVNGAIVNSSRPENQPQEVAELFLKQIEALQRASC